MLGSENADRINELEDMLEVNRDDERIRQMKEDVEKYEETGRKQAVISEQAKRKEREAARLAGQHCQNGKEEIDGFNKSKKLRPNTRCLDSTYI